jgi:hypothetical protein
LSTNHANSNQNQHHLSEFFDPRLLDLRNFPQSSVETPVSQNDFSPTEDRFTFPAEQSHQVELPPAFSPISNSSLQRASPSAEQSLPGDASSLQPSQAPPNIPSLFCSTCDEDMSSLILEHTCFQDPFKNFLSLLDMSHNY